MTDHTTRHCGDCQLCCKLMPMKAGQEEQVGRTMIAMIDAGVATLRDFAGAAPDFYKPAGERCKHQRAGKGCVIYSRRPFGCRVWNCRWLVGDDTATLRRPDRSHYVIDLMPDFIRAVPPDGGEPILIEVVVVWCDPGYPDAHRDPELRAYLERRGEENMATLVRYNASDAITLIPPAMSGDDAWHEVAGGTVVKERSTWPGQTLQPVT